MTEILDVSRDNDTDEITQFLILENGQPETKIATPENLLLYDPADELPFEGGLNDFLSGSNALRVSSEPEIVVKQSNDEYSYMLSVDDNLVETTPNQAEELLRGVYGAMADDDETRLANLHREILETQVRRPIVNALKKTFDERERIEIVANGWLIDAFYLVDWNANLYGANDDPQEGDYVRSGGKAVKKDTTYELCDLSGNLSVIDGFSVTLGGDEYSLTERELLFLSKVKWVLHRRHYHPDEAFWRYVDRWADVDVETGRPETEDEPNLDVYDL